MTEFVITLPIFITIFIGITGLHQLQDGATRAHPVANRAMWQLATEVANSEPTSKWGDPSRLGKYEDLEREDNETFGYDETKHMRLYDYGTLGEAMSGANYTETAQWGFRDENRGECEDCTYDFVTENHYLSSGFTANAITDQGAIVERLPAHVDQEYQAMRNTFPENPPKSRLAYGAGSRYGIVQGVAARSVEWFGWKQTFKPQYRITAPSRTLETEDEAFGSVSVARVELERWEWADVTGFQVPRSDRRFDFEFGLGPNEYMSRRHDEDVLGP